jgi:hypothetical protein
VAAVDWTESDRHLDAFGPGLFSPLLAESSVL